MPGVSGNSTPQAISGISDVTTPLTPTESVAATAAGDASNIASKIGAVVTTALTGNAGELDPIIGDLEKALIAGLSNAAMAIPVVGPLVGEAVNIEAPKALPLLANAIGNIADHIGIKLAPEFQSWLKDLNAAW